MLTRSRSGSLLFAALIAIAVGGCAGGPMSGEQAPGTPVGTTNKLAELHTQLGVGYLRGGKLELAWKRLHSALEADPNYSAAHTAMGLLYERMNEPAKAEEHFRRAVELDPVNSAAQNNYGTFLCAHKRYKDGEQRFLQAIKNPLNPTPQTAYANAGLCMLQAGNQDKAESYLRSALELDPKLAVALLNMAEISFDEKNALSARAYLQRYLEVGKQTPRTLWLGIRIERVLGDHDTESSYALLLRRKFPDSQEAGLLERSESQ